MATRAVKILGDEIKTPTSVPFTLNFAMKATQKPLAFEQVEEELAYNAKAQINNASLNPTMGKSTCTKNSNTTTRIIGSDTDPDTQMDD